MSCSRRDRRLLCSGGDDKKSAPPTMKPAPAPKEEVPADTLSLIQVRWGEA